MNKLNADFLNLFVIVFSVISILILMILVIHSIYDNRLTKNKIRKINKIDKLNIEDIERLDVNELEKYKYEIRHVYLFNKRKKIIIKRKIDKYIKDTFFKLLETEDIFINNIAKEHNFNLNKVNVIFISEYEYDRVFLDEILYSSSLGIKFGVIKNLDEKNFENKAYLYMQIDTL